MAEDWNKIANEVAKALDSVGGSGLLEQVVSESGSDSDPTQTTRLVPVTVLSSNVARRDVNGVVTGYKRTLTIKSTGVTPEKGWRIQVQGQWHRISEVRSVSPGGVDLMFKMELEG